jgi:hypothetical protein
LAFLGISDKDSVAAVRKCEERFGDQWVDEWLRRRGLSLGDTLGEDEKSDPEREEERRAFVECGF